MPSADHTVTYFLCSLKQKCGVKQLTAFDIDRRCLQKGLADSTDSTLYHKKRICDMRAWLLCNLPILTWRYVLFWKFHGAFIWEKFNEIYKLSSLYQNCRDGSLMSWELCSVLAEQVFFGLSTVRKISVKSLCSSLYYWLIFFCYCF